MLEKKRDLMAKLLTDVGFKPIIPQGGYFMMADTSDIGYYPFTRFFNTESVILANTDKSVLLYAFSLVT